MGRAGMPAATPAAISTRLNREVNDILEAADTREALVAQGVEPEPGPPEAVTQRIRTDIDKWRGVVAKAGISGGSKVLTTRRTPAAWKRTDER